MANQRVLVLGGNFAGLMAALSLKHDLGDDVDLPLTGQTSSRASAGDRSLRHTLQARPALGVPVVAVGLQHDPLDLLEGPPEALGRELLAVLVAEALAQPHLQGRLVDPVRPARNKTCSHTPGDLLRERGGIRVATKPGDPCCCPR